MRDYLRPRLTPPPLPPVVPVPDQLKQHYAGYYQNISPMMQWSQGINRWLNARTLTVASNGLSVSLHGFYKHRVLPVTERLYRDENASLATVALLPDSDGHTEFNAGWKPSNEFRPWNTGRNSLA